MEELYLRSNHYKLILKRVKLTKVFLIEIWDKNSNVQANWSVVRVDWLVHWVVPRILKVGQDFEENSIRIAGHPFALPMLILYWVLFKFIGWTEIKGLLYHWNVFAMNQWKLIKFLNWSKLVILLALLKKYLLELFLGQIWSEIHVSGQKGANALFILSDICFELVQAFFSPGNIFCLLATGKMAV